MPMNYFVYVVETFNLTTTVNFIDISPLCQLKWETTICIWYLSCPILGVWEFYYCTPSFNYKTIPSSFYYWLQYVWVNSIIKIIQSFDRGWLFPGITPWIIDLQSSWFFLLAKLCWWMIWLAIMVTRMEIKKLIFQTTSSLTMNAFWFVYYFLMACWCYLIKKSYTDELDSFRIIEDMQVVFIFVISQCLLIFVTLKFFPWFDD